MIDIPLPWHWSTGQSANVISLISAIATVWTLLYAIRQGVKNSKKINDLAEITRELATQNNLIYEQLNLQKKMMKHQAAPEIYVSYIELSASNRSYLHISVANKGPRAVISKIEFKGDPDVVFEDERENIILLQGETIDLECHSNSVRKMQECRWTFMIYYRDSFANNYHYSLIGEGKTVEFTANAEVNA